MLLRTIPVRSRNVLPYLTSPYIPHTPQCPHLRSRHFAVTLLPIHLLVHTSLAPCLVLIHVCAHHPFPRPGTKKDKEESLAPSDKISRVRLAYQIKLFTPPRLHHIGRQPNLPLAHGCPVHRLGRGAVDLLASTSGYRRDTVLRTS